MSHITDIDSDGTLDQAALDHFRDRLQQARNDLLSRNQQRLGEVLEKEACLADEADHAVADSEQQFQLRLADKDRKLLDLIEHALRKIERGDYGLCEGTGEPIPRARLELRPWARYSVEHKLVLERERELHSGS